MCVTENFCVRMCVDAYVFHIRFSGSSYVSALILAGKKKLNVHLFSTQPNLYIQKYLQLHYWCDLFVFIISEAFHRFAGDIIFFLHMYFAFALVSIRFIFCYPFLVLS